MQNMKGLLYDLFTQICSNNAVCENTPGSYHCNCKDGFKETNSGRSCVGKGSFIVFNFSLLNFLFVLAC